jgi:MFS transporter, DHA1 family, tetracycline resistance protein
MQKNQASIIFIFITILIDVIGVGLIIPILPDLIQSFVGGDETEAAKYGGFLMGIYGLMQFVFAPIIGGLSDRYGRRPVLLASMFAFALDYILLALAPSLAWLVVGRIVAGITGASFTTATAYIADISTPENRSKNFGLVGAAFGIGFIIGPIIGGFLADISLRTPFWVAAVMSLLNGLYGLFILPESLKAENRRPFDWKRANPIGSFLQLKKYKSIHFLIGGLFILFVAGQVHPSTWTYFTAKMFGWTPKQVAISLAFVGLVIAIVQGGLVGVITKKIGQERAIKIGFLFYVIGFLLFSIASQGWMMYVFMLPFGVSGLVAPNIQAVVSGKVRPDEQGELQGIIAILTSFTAFLGPLLHTNLFYWFTNHRLGVDFPGAAFFAGGLLSLVAYWVVRKFFSNERAHLLTKK